jgi:cell wall assembly regulator SMI1
MREVWMTIEAWLERNAPDIHQDLNPGIDVAAIREAQKALECDIPESVQSSLAIHNGTRGSAPPLIGSWRLLSIEHLVREWKLMNQLLQDGVFGDEPATSDPEVKPLWWHRRWLPVARNAAGDLVCADMDPASPGRSGQLITVWQSDARRPLLAVGFREWLSEFASDLQAGRYRVDETGALQRVS